MPNKYVEFISDEHFLSCIANLHKSYINAKDDFTKIKFYKNKIDTIKLKFDALFNNINEEDLIEVEILRQIDKSINNAIGTFHEQILGGVSGYEIGNLSGFDIKSSGKDTLFADIKNKHNTMNSSAAEALFQKLKVFADKNKKANCYWVQILAKASFNTRWIGDINGKEYSHSRVFKISGDKFYELLTGHEDALLQIYKALPSVINDYLATLDPLEQTANNSAIEEIKDASENSGRDILDQITFENYPYYLGFDEL